MSVGMEKSFVSGFAGKESTKNSWTDSLNSISWMTCDDGQYYWGFRVLCYVYRFFGLHSLSGIGSSRSLNFSFRSSWALILYDSIICCVAVWISSGLIILKLEDFYGGDRDRIINDIYVIGFSFYTVVSYGGMLINYILNWKNIVGFVQQCVALETVVKLNDKSNLLLRATVVAFLVVLVIGIIKAPLIILNESISENLLENHNTSAKPSLIFRVAVVFGLGFSVPASLCLEIWMIYYAIVFTLYFHHINSRVEKILENNIPLNVHILKHNHQIFLMVADVFSDAATVFSYSILAGYTVNFCFACFTGCLAVLAKNPAIFSLFLQDIVGYAGRVTVPTLFCGYMSMKVIAYDLKESISSMLRSAACLIRISACHLNVRPFPRSLNTI